MMDEQALATLKRDVGDEMFPMILEQFAIELHGKIEQLERAFGDADLAQIGELAHSLKSTTRTLGLTAVADLVASVEHHARAADQATLQQGDSLLALCREAASVIDNKVSEQQS